MTQNARRLQAERLQGPAALREAQALRYRVFSTEFDAKLNGAELGLDMEQVVRAKLADNERRFLGDAP